MTEMDLETRTVKALHDVLDSLRIDTNAGRTTVRLDDCGLGFHVDTVAAETLSDGVHSIRTHNSLDQKNAAAVKWLLIHPQIRNAAHRISNLRHPFFHHP